MSYRRSLLALFLGLRTTPFIAALGSRAAKSLPAALPRTRGDEIIHVMYYSLVIYSMRQYAGASGGNVGRP